MRRRLTTAGLCAAMLVPIGIGVAQAAPAPHAATHGTTRQQAFASAAGEFGVPEQVLLAVSYNESLWEQHAGQPSTSGTYGAMSLADAPADARGTGDSTTALHTLGTAARLAHVTPAAARTDATSNIRAGAALLASYARMYDHGALPATVAGWYGPVAAYSGSQSKVAASDFANDVYGTIRTGAARTTADGQTLRLPADAAVKPDTATIAPLHLTPAAKSSAAECPRTLDCDFVPAAYKLNSSDPQDYGNYDTADRPHQVKIDQIVLHDTEESYPDTLAGFTNPASYVSAHYVIRSADGHVTQMVPTKDVAWQAGNWYVNSHSVGIEQEGFAVAGATWFTEQLYHSSAQLVRYLAAKYDIPLDRQHIIGHDNVPGINAAGVAGMHWDPGPYWDWGHYLALLGKPIHQTGTSHSPVVTINPRFASNVQTVTDCEAGTSLPDQATSFVYLHTAPSASAPLLSDPALHPDGKAGTTCAADWGDKASVGQQFVVADRKGDWTGIWWDGVEAWFQNEKATTPSYGFVVTPKPGLASVPTYGRALPEPAAYPADIPVQAVTPLQYTLKPGQRYVTSGAVPTDYYYAKTIDNSLPDDHTNVVGHDKYLQIQLGHRIGYVKAADVNVRLAVG
ncbi:MAG TPA: N-acetylmuramoyl-L-alanine amidase [Mycobacteriales bacterium]|nr:N-acetylmuramoyl-L-alanine amidase [Mycobacteriales bacterium]